MTTGKLETLTTKEHKCLFLKKYEYFGAVWPACKAAGIKSRSTPYSWKKTDSIFAAAFDEIQERVEDDLASEMILIAKGKKDRTGVQLEAMKFQLKALNPKKYCEKYQVGGENGKPIQVEIDAKGKLLSALNRFATRAGESTGDKQAQPEGS